MKLALQGVINNFERFSMRKQNLTFQKLRKKILKRDDFACQFCYFRSPENEVINRDNDYTNNKPDNMVTACPLCARGTLMDFYQINYDGKDQMIYLPEMTQEQLNHLCRLLFCRINDPGEAAYNAQMILAQLQDRAKVLDDNAGTQLSHPGIFLHYLHAQDRDRELVQKIRWLPSPDSFQMYVEHWRDVLANQV